MDVESPPAPAPSQPPFGPLDALVAEVRGLRADHKTESAATRASIDKQTTWGLRIGATVLFFFFALTVFLISALLLKQGIDPSAAAAPVQTVLHGAQASEPAP